jgi:hypothetical protein
MRFWKLRAWRLGVLAAGLTMLAGCDPTVRATLEDGAVNLSSGLFGSFLRAAFNLAIEANTTP